MLFDRRAYVAIALLLAFSMLSGNILHTLVRHHHDHDGRGNIVEIWAGLHSSLHHDAKKTLFSASASLPLLVLVLLSDLAALVYLNIRRSARVFYVRERDPILGRLLRRGVLRYIAFG